MKTGRAKVVDYDHPQTATSDDIAHLAYLLVKEAGICARCHKGVGKGWTRALRQLHTLLEK